MMRSSVSPNPVAAGPRRKNPLAPIAEATTGLGSNVMYPKIRMRVSTNDDGVARLEFYVLL